ncbi:hypothetical protein HF086_016815 [Spodoptera exigua]|uniref:UBA domain-containing protein n=1 Tax=Spodoptera exigua TaxID=7107 RepID=A0A922ML85_SPOEX|nr:hypothetical protein HF086_016815 [Spodoptera exigua]
MMMMCVVYQLEAMGYEKEAARAALRHSRNHISGAVDRLLAGTGAALHKGDDPEDPSTSSGVVSKKKKTKKAHKKDKRRKERDQALRRLTAAIKTEEDDYLDTSLTEEEEFLAQYKSLL